jgi:hypothetical protein
VSDDGAVPERRIEVKRHAERGAYDRSVVYEILDAVPWCTVAFDEHDPVAIPTIHAGAPALMVRIIREAGDPCSIRVSSTPVGRVAWVGMGDRRSRGEARTHAALHRAHPFRPVGRCPPAQ